METPAPLDPDYSLIISWYNSLSLLAMFSLCLYCNISVRDMQTVLSKVCSSETTTDTYMGYFILPEICMIPYSKVPVRVTDDDMEYMVRSQSTKIMSTRYASIATMDSTDGNMEGSLMAEISVKEKVNKMKRRERYGADKKPIEYVPTNEDTDPDTDEEENKDNGSIGDTDDEESEHEDG